MTNTMLAAEEAMLVRRERIIQAAYQKHQHDSTALIGILRFVWEDGADTATQRAIDVVRHHT